MRRRSAASNRTSRTSHVACSIGGIPSRSGRWTGRASIDESCRRRGRAVPSDAPAGAVDAGARSLRGARARRVAAMGARVPRVPPRHRPHPVFRAERRLRRSAAASLREAADPDVPRRDARRRSRRLQALGAAAPVAHACDPLRIRGDGTVGVRARRPAARVRAHRRHGHPERSGSRRSRPTPMRRFRRRAVPTCWRWAGSGG